MNAARSLLLTLLDIAAAQAAGRSPVEVDLTALLGEVATPASAAACAQLLIQAAAGRVPAEQLLPKLEALAPSLGADERQASRAAALADQLQTVAALARADPAGALTAATIDLATSPLAALVTVWHLEGAPANCVVCMEGLSGADRLVQPRGEHPLQRRLRLRYEQASPFPLLETELPMVTARDTAPAPRGPWRQRDLPDYDVRLFSEQGRPLGHVQTRRREPPGVLSGTGLTIELRGDAGVQLLVTELRDLQDQTLLSLWRWPALADT